MSKLFRYQTDYHTQAFQRFWRITRPQRPSDCQQGGQGQADAAAYHFAAPAASRHCWRDGAAARHAIHTYYIVPVLEVLLASYMY